MPFIPDTSVKPLDKKSLRDLHVRAANEQAKKYREESASYGGGTWKGAFSTEANKVANKVVDFTGMRSATDVFSSNFARSESNAEQQKFIPKPTEMQNAGALGGAALTLYPGATIAKEVKFAVGSLIGKIASKEAAIGTASTLAKEKFKRGITKLSGNVASFGGAGYGYEASSKMAEGKTGSEAFMPGAGTAITAALPLTPLVFSGTKKMLGKAAQETFGATTGTGMGVIRTAYESAKEGGEKAATFVKAMRGNTSPEEIVGAAKESLGEIIQKRSSDYEAALSKVAGMTEQIDTTPVAKAIQTGLKKFGVKVTSEGLDFSRSTLRFNRKAQDEITTIIDEMASFGTKEGDNTALGIDRLKRAFSDLYSDSSEARAFVASVTGETRKLLSKVPGYDVMSQAYGESTGLIKEIQKGLSLGNKASIDTAFRKLSTTLRTNNEFRKQLVDELDKISGGTLSSQIAGQQLSEIVPRGLAKIGVAGAGAIGFASGGLGVVALLKLAATSSPRLIGEFANALGVGAREYGKFLETIGIKAGKDLLQKTRLPGDIILDSPFGKKLKEGIKSMKGKGGLNLNDVSGGKAGYDDALLQEARKYKSAEEFVKAQGTPIYHGTAGKFDAFDDTMKGSVTGAKSAHGAIWFTDNKDVAKAYSVYAAETGPVNKIMRQADEAEKLAQKTGKESDWLKYDKLTQEMEKLDTYDANFERRKLANVKEAVAKGDFYSVDAKGKTPQELSADGDIDSWLSLQVEKAKKLGKDGLVIKNIDDAVGLYNRPSTHYAIFDAKKITTKSQLIDLYSQAAKGTKSELDSFLQNWVRTDKKAPSISKSQIAKIAEEAKDFKPKEPVTLYRGTGLKEDGTQPQSWTYNKEAAQMHAENKGGKVIARKVSPDEILVDSTEMPSSLSEKYGFIGEEEEVILKPSQETKRGFGTGAGRSKDITKAQETKATERSLREVLQDGVKQHIKNLEGKNKIDFNAVAKYQDLLKRAPKITDIQALTRNIVELERKGKMKLLDEAIKIRDETLKTLKDKLNKK